jgi:hypothetical protein
MALTFFKTARNKKFDYKPVFWNKEKEEREKRFKAASEQKDKDYAEALREKLDMRWKRTAGTRERKNTNMRLMVILGIIFLLFYFLFVR